MIRADPELRAQLEVAHALGKSLTEVEQMGCSEFTLHLAFMGLKAEEERNAYEKAGAGQGKPKMQSVISFRR
jgi:hypothetical protein